MKIRTIFFCFILFFVFSCTSDKEYTAIDFSDTISIPKPQREVVSAKQIRVAVAAMISPKETFVYYQELLNYLGDRLGYSIKLVQRKTYLETNELFLKGLVDMAFICTGPYAKDKGDYGFEGLATPIVRGNPFYQSYLIVNRDSPFTSLDDLRNHRFAFTDPESNTGALVPTYWLSQMGETPTTFFKSFSFTYSHDNSILAVAKNLVEGATVDGHKWEYYNLRNPVYTSKTRIIKKSKNFGGPPLVISVNLAAEFKDRLRKVLFSMHEDSNGKLILDELLIDKFVAPEKEWYLPVQVMIKKTKTIAGKQNEAKKP